MKLEPIRITQKQACELLSISREAIRKIIDSDPSFPKPYKTGTSRQCAVYFDYEALKEWHQSKMKA